MSLLLSLALTACSSQKASAAQTTLAQTEAETTQAVTESTAEAAKTAESEPVDGKTLVVYYTSTNHTKKVADYITAATGADQFELVPVSPYTSADLNWNDKNSRVSYEHDHPDDRNVELTQTTVPDWESYDTVFIGYPIWWGIAAWPVDGFIDANDFTGKTVIPFCTSMSSGLGDSGKLLAEAAKTGNWQTGQRFSSNASEEEVRIWVEGLER
jgi:hypothetical protein